ncbi:Uu.00g085190.m01.CDS01 [Anthostomella pinea]|uniref:Uu.00g085190.m01.CDS01 n=1 Tax=Anthostomella pinea TaxID=933095 RepID=A0AAI8VLZ4_9PEZI|nr:Uu.00g085190.m01.CDS01 [Anthostomella pinea]
MATSTPKCGSQCDPEKKERVFTCEDGFGSPRFLHLHNEKGACLSEKTTATASYVIKHHNKSGDLEFYYLTSEKLQERKRRPAKSTSPNATVPKVGCRIVGMVANLSFLRDTLDGKMTLLEEVRLIHIHNTTTQTDEEFRAELLRSEKPPLSLEELEAQAEMDVGVLDRLRAPFNPVARTRRVAVERHLQPSFMPGSCNFRIDQEARE